MPEHVSTATLPELALTGIRLQRASHIFSEITKSKRITLSAENTLLVDGSDTEIPLRQLLYKSQTIPLSNLPASYSEIFRILNLVPQDFT